MPLLYEDYETVWRGNLEEAESYWKTAELPKGYYVCTIDFSAIPDYIFWIVKLAKDLELTLEQWQGKGLISWKWDGKTLIMYLVEASPAVPLIIYGVVAVILGILTVIGLIYAKDIAVEVRRMVEEAPLGMQILLMGAGIALIGGTIFLISRRKR